LLNYARDFVVNWRRYGCMVLRFAGVPWFWRGPSKLDFTYLF